MDQPKAKQVSPQWAPDGSGVYFISDRDGTSNVYSVDLVSGALRQVTDVARRRHRHHVDEPGAGSGLAGRNARIQRLPRRPLRDRNPELKVPRRRGHVVDSRTEPALRLRARREHSPELLADSQFGLPVKTTSRVRSRTTIGFSLESVAPPFIGAASGAGFGSAVPRVDRRVVRRHAPQQAT